MKTSIVHFERETNNKKLFDQNEDELFVAVVSCWGWFRPVGSYCERHPRQCRCRRCYRYRSSSSDDVDASTDVKMEQEIHTVVRIATATSIILATAARSTTPVRRPKSAL